MVRIDDLYSVLNDDLLDIIYEDRCEKLSKITIEGKKNINNLLETKYKAYEHIDIAINNVPNGFVETRKIIKESIEKYLEVLKLLESYENEKFYKCGFCDGINMELNRKVWYR